MLWRRRNPQDVADQAEVDRIVETWHRTCEAIGLTDDRQTVTGTTHVVPRIDHVTLGPPIVLSVRLTHGMMPEDLIGQARRIARSMGAQGLRVEPRGFTHVLVTLLADDPLSEHYSDIPETGPIVVGRDESGQDVTVGRLPHTLIAGASGSGKSMGAYSLIIQSLRRGSVIRGVDPSNTTLRSLPGCITGTRDLGAVEAHLTSLTADMDRRMNALPWDADVLPICDRNPHTVIVMDEYPSLVRALESADKRTAAAIRGCVSRILCEGRKVNMAVVLIAQRPEANLIGGTERAQAGLRIAYRLDGADSLKLIMPDAVDQAAEHATAPAGVALVSSPGRPVARIRSPYLPYADYVRRIAA